MVLQAMLVDDEFPARGELRCLLEEIGGIEVVVECEDGDEALDVLNKTDVDVVFLDIQMSSKDGLSTAAEIIQLDKPPKIVFTTGFSEYAVNAFELEAADYVVKPYSRSRLELTVSRLIEPDTEKNNNERVISFLGNNLGIERLPVWTNDRMIFLDYEEIFFIKAVAKRKTLICTKRGKFITGFTLKELENRLPATQFLRTHKSFLVNSHRIDEVIPWFNNTYVINFRDCSEKEIPVSRHYIKEFKEIMKI